MLRGVAAAGSPVPVEQQLAVAEQGSGSDEMWSHFLPHGPLADQGWLVECPRGSCPGWGGDRPAGGGALPCGYQALPETG